MQNNTKIWFKLDDNFGSKKLQKTAQNNRKYTQNVNKIYLYLRNKNGCE